ncbi:hypothetical protein Anas_00937, partial [Armadillidium nasatum]
MRSKKKLGQQDNVSQFTIDITQPMNFKSDILLNLCNEFSKVSSGSEKIVALNQALAYVRDEN